MDVIWNVFSFAELSQEFLGVQNILIVVEEKCLGEFMFREK